MTLIPKGMVDKIRFEWKDLEGKTLNIHVREGIENGIKYCVVCGVDRKTGIVYLLHSEATGQTKRAFSVEGKEIDKGIY